MSNMITAIEIVKLKNLIYKKAYDAWNKSYN